jgi:uncharacterized protein (DUF362 family)
VVTIRRLAGLIKPNWVREQGSLGPCVTTHGSILRVLIDYFLLGFGRDVQILVADIPLQSSDIGQVWLENGIPALQSFYQKHGFSVRFLDLRRERLLVDDSGFILQREKLSGDPEGYVEVSLGGQSNLEAITNEGTRFSVSDYEPGTTRCHHQPGRHSYLIPQSVLAADLFVSVPKLKTHCKAGITVCMKNLIGINGEKGWIPHFRSGAPQSGGDEYPDSNSRLLGLKTWARQTLLRQHQGVYRLAYAAWQGLRWTVETTSKSHLTSGGAWAGNDTLWRSILDLVRVITFADRYGHLQTTPQRKHFFLVDGILAGEGQGPLRPSPKPSGVILAARDAVIADLAAAMIMGFDWRKVPQLCHAMERADAMSSFPSSPDELTVSWKSADPDFASLDTLPVTPFKPARGWSQAMASAEQYQC